MSHLEKSPEPVEVSIAEPEIHCPGGPLLKGEQNVLRVFLFTLPDRLELDSPEKAEAV